MGSLGSDDEIESTVTLPTELRVWTEKVGDDLGYIARTGQGTSTNETEGPQNFGFTLIMTELQQWRLERVLVNNFPS